MTTYAFMDIIEPSNGIGLRQSASLEKLLPALLEFQQAAPVVVKTLHNQQTKSQYADLADIWQGIHPLLCEQGLIPILCPGGIREVNDTSAAMAMVCRIAHVSGEFIEHTGEVFVPAPIISREKQVEVTNATQRAGSAITYMRRYMMVTMLNLILGDDDDAARAHSQGRTGMSTLQSQEQLERMAQPWQEQIKSGFACNECQVPGAPDSRKMGDCSNEELGKLLKAEKANGENNQFVLAEAMRRNFLVAAKYGLETAEKLQKAILNKGWKGPDIWDLRAADMILLSMFFYQNFVVKTPEATDQP